VTQEFRQQLARLPAVVQEQAARAYALWRSNPDHNSLQFKRVSQRQPIYAVRIGLGYRALGLREAEQIYWFWIGSHAEYDELLRRL
jgi:hypothetical protein